MHPEIERIDNLASELDIIHGRSTGEQRIMHQRWMCDIRPCVVRKAKRQDPIEQEFVRVFCKIAESGFRLAYSG